MITPMLRSSRGRASRDVALKDRCDQILPPLLYKLASEQWKFGGLPFDIHRVD